jgi:hypothetical protein
MWAISKSNDWNLFHCNGLRVNFKLEIMWERIKDLPIRIEGYKLEGLQLAVSDSFLRSTTIIRLHGAGATGCGEEVNWDVDLQQKFRQRGGYLPLAGEHTLASFSALLDSLELSPDPPPVDHWLDFRRWAFESAALDLALRQSQMGIEQALGVQADSLHFAVSLGLHDYGPVAERLAVHPTLRFKLDATPDWSTDLCAQLAQSQAVDVVDFKGAYVGTPVDVAPDLSLYQRVLDAMPEVIIEDPHNDPEILDFLRERRARIAWDAPIHAMADVTAMPLAPDQLNIKPSRFGTLESLFEAYDECARQGFPMYGGGQFELGIGREQIQVLAALFHPDGYNDVAPSVYHQIDRATVLPASPLGLSLAESGFGLC